MTQQEERETIAAVATGPARAAVAIIRVSGPHALTVSRALTGVDVPPRRASLRALRNPESDELIDSGIVLVFPGPDSVTGEDCAEFQVHGGVAVTREVLDLICSMPGVRAAAAGEFTRRAFSNGRLDLTQVEALADLIAADTPVQRRVATRAFEGWFGSDVRSWRDRLLTVRAAIEASIDFSDEDDVDVAATEIAADIDSLAWSMKEAYAGAVRQERVAAGLTVVLAGPPNAGKSSLLNAIARRDVAIVTSVPGTTRDVLDLRLELSGLPVTVRDVAGLRETDDAVERIGVARAHDAIQSADLVLWLSEDDAPCPVASAVLVRSKVDCRAVERRSGVLNVSSVTGEGVADVIALMQAHARDLAASAEVGWTLNRRQGDCLGRAIASLGSAQQGVASGLEFAAADLARACESLEELTGSIGVEHVLGTIFSRFCVGK